MDEVIVSPADKGQFFTPPALAKRVIELAAWPGWAGPGSARHGRARQAGLGMAGMALPGDPCQVMACGGSGWLGTARQAGDAGARRRGQPAPRRRR